MDYTGCGNTLDMQHPRVLQLLMDSLRYWVTEMHVDGFRFDLASALARELHEVDRLGAFFDILRQDPVLSHVKLIAEPWDLGEGGYQVGNFPPGWAEWNDKYRDTMRAYWSGDGGLIGEFARRLTGSTRPLRRAAAGGRTRASTSSPRTTASRCSDLVSYNDKHNEANGEDNRDGSDNNRLVELRRRGPDRRSGDRRAARARRSATSSRRCCSRKACRCCSPATRSAARSRATTTPTARTRHLLGRLDRDEARTAAARVRPPHDRAAPRSIRCSGAATSSRGVRCVAAAARTSSG